MRDACIDRNLGGGMSSSGAQMALWSGNHSFVFQSCGSPATTTWLRADTEPAIECTSLYKSDVYVYMIGAKKHGRGFAELGVVPQFA
jgi:hypothetical protein